MSEFSRVKRNQKLYETLLEENPQTMIDNSLEDYHKRVNENKLESLKIDVEDLALSKSVDLDNIDNKEELKINSDILSDKDLLESFIDEVKHYNINRGLRSVSDTQMNILNEINEKVEVSDQVEKESTQSLLTLDSDRDKQLTDMFSQINQVEQEEISENSESLELFDKDLDTTFEDEEIKNNYKASELSQLTHTLNLKLNLEEKAVEVDNDSVSFLDRLLTFITIVLSIILIGLIGYGIYWYLLENGIIG